MKTLDVQEIKHLFELFGTGENGIKEFKDTLNKVKTLGSVQNLFIIL